MALGQFHLIPLAMMVLAEVFSSRVLIAGTLIGLALIKPTMVVPYVVLMAIRGQWRALFVAASVQAVLFGATSWQLGKDPLFLTREWVRNARAQSTQGTIDVPTLISQFRTDRVVDPSVISLLILSLFAVIFVVLRRKSGLGLFAIATFSAAVFTYHRHYDLVLLLPTLAYLIHSCTGTGRTRSVYPAVLMTFMIILPSSEKLLGDWESTYELFFKASSYLFLAILLGRVASEPEASTRT